MSAAHERARHWSRDWARDSGLILSSQVTLTAATSALSVLLARSLGPSDFGIFSSFLALSQAFALLIDLGLTSRLLRDLSRLWRDPHNINADRDAVTLLRSAVAINAALGSSLTAVSFLAALAAGLSLELAAVLTGLMAYVTLVAASTALEASLRARRRLRGLLGAWFVEKTLLLGLAAAVLASGASIAALGGVYVLAGTARLCMDYRSTLHRLPRVGGRPSLRELRNVARASAPFALNAAALVLVPRLDIPLVALFSVVAASSFALGWQIVTTLILIPTVASSALYPFLAHGSIGRRAVWKVSGLLLAAGAVAAIVAIPLTPTFVPLFFGDSYRIAVPTIQLMLLALPFIFAENGLMASLYSAGHERGMLRLTAPAALAATLLVIAGQAILGPTGAALGFTARYLLLGAALITLVLRVSRPR